MFKALDDWIRNPEGAVYAAVLGESGIGKTTLLKTQTLHLINARRQDPSLPLPIYIDLRLFMPTIQEQKKVPTDLVELLNEILPRAKHRGDVSGISGVDIWVSVGPCASRQSVHAAMHRAQAACGATIP